MNSTTVGSLTFQKQRSDETQSAGPKINEVTLGVTGSYKPINSHNHIHKHLNATQITNTESVDNPQTSIKVEQKNSNVHALKSEGPTTVLSKLEGFNVTTDQAMHPCSNEPQPPGITKTLTHSYDNETNNAKAQQRSPEGKDLDFEQRSRRPREDEEGDQAKRCHHYDTTEGKDSGNAAGVSPPEDGQSGKPTAHQNFFRKYQYQVLLVSLSVFGSMTGGAVLAYPSVIISDVEVYNSTLYGTHIAFSDTLQDLLASSANMGAVVGVWVCGLTMGPFGRRNVMRGLGLFGILAWAGVALSPTALVCLIFRVCTGAVYGGITVTVVAYIVEISSQEVRGTFAITSAGALTLGQVVSVVPAYWLHYYEVAFINCFYPAVFLMGALFVLPESPTVLVIKGLEEKATKVLLRLRGSGADVAEEIKAYVQLNELQRDASVFKVLRQPEMLKRLAIVCTLFFIQVFSGYTIFVAQTARIIQDSGSDMNPNLATILVQLAQLAGVLMAMGFVDRIGRRYSLLLSHVTMTVAVASLATFTLLLRDGGADGNEDSKQPQPQHSQPTLEELLSMSNAWLARTMDSFRGTPALDDAENSYGWVPLVCLMVTQMGASFGIQSIPFMLASEYFPTAVRPKAASICVSWCMVLGIINLQIYTPMQNAIGQAGLLYMNSAFALLGVPFALFFVKETKGIRVG